MTAADDLRDLRDNLDGTLAGSVLSWKRASTKTGQDCFDLNMEIRAKRYREWGETISLRARLSRALLDNEGLREGNSQMTEQICRLEEALKCQGK